MQFCCMQLKSEKCKCFAICVLDERIRLCGAQSLKVALQFDATHVMKQI